MTHREWVAWNEAVRTAYAVRRRRAVATPSSNTPTSALPGSGTMAMNVGDGMPVAKVDTVSPSGLIWLIWLRALSAA